MVFPEDDDKEADELLAVLRLTIQNKRTAFNKTKNVTATATPTTTSSEVLGEAVEAVLEDLEVDKCKRGSEK